jgi:hypothetical protein
MAAELVSGICSTRSTLDELDGTYLWDVQEAGDYLEIIVRYGVGKDTSNVGTASIPVGNTSAVSITPAKNAVITVQGTVRAAWSDNNRSYVITFSGEMNRPRTSNVFSSDRLVSRGGSPIIVGAYLSS